jgi:polysaccharide pyruvyl transferase WcaK-like protein
MNRTTVTEKEQQGLVGRSCEPAAVPADNSSGLSRSRSPLRIALLTPYTGGNLGDAAIQDAMIANLRLRLPDVKISGLSLNSDNFIERHGADAFPLTGATKPFQAMSRDRTLDQLGHGASSRARSSRGIFNLAETKKLVGRAPLLGPYLRRAYACAKHIWRELSHTVKGYRFIRGHDLLIVSGGGQLDREWGGAWGHPFALFKWAILARIARVPCAVASVGVGTVSSTTSRFFLKGALRAAQYRSYRERNSRILVTRMMRRAAQDPVVPDLAFSLPPSEIPTPAGIRSISQGRTIIGISPIAYARPHTWPYQNKALYERYVQQMAKVISQLLERRYFLVILWSSLSDRETVVPDILQRLDDKLPRHLASQLHIPKIETWKDLVALLQDVDYLVASRLHSTILGMVSLKPTVAISFDPKVDWAMEEVGQSRYVLSIRNFTAEDVVERIESLEECRGVLVEQIGSYKERALSVCTSQYQVLAQLALASYLHRH